jgi:proteasome beta subunit
MVAGDRLATMEYRVASREIEKVFATDDYSLMAVAGAAGPAMEMARLLGIQFEHHEKIEGERLELEGKANTLAHLIKQNLPAAMQGLVVVPIFAGYDCRRQIGRLWRYEVTGGRYEEKEYDSVGSGSLFARESLKKSFRPDASRDEALAMVLEALADAADEDRGTGGVDAVRGIYPRVKTCTSRGIEEITDEQVSGIHQSIVDSRRRPVE